jgi:hypothetical protein
MKNLSPSLFFLFSTNIKSAQMNALFTANIRRACEYANQIVDPWNKRIFNSKHKLIHWHEKSYPTKAPSKDSYFYSMKATSYGELFFIKKVQ